MKKTIAFLVSLSLCIISIPAYNADFEISAESLAENGFEYDISSDFAEIVSCSDDSENIVIPDNINGVPVKAIADNAFGECTNLITVTIPESIEYITGNVFSGCTNLTAIEVSENNPAYSSSDGMLFNKDKTELIAVPSKISKAVLPDSLMTIKQLAFNNCSEITEITVPQSVENIEMYAFQGCTNLENIDVSDSISCIGSNAFSDTAWYKNLPDGVVYIGKIAYGYKGEMPEDTEITLDDGTKAVAQWAFSKQENLKSIVMPESVEYIGNNAFFCCYGLRDADIPQNVTDIGADAFKFCSALEKIDIPESVENIGDYAFANCTSLSEINFPDSAVYIGKTIFDNTPWYENQNDGVVYIGKIAYGYKGEMPEDTCISIKNGTMGIACYAFSNCENLIDIYMPVTLEYIGGSSFSFCTGLISVKLPSFVEYIGNMAFFACDSLETVSIPENMKSIQEKAFYRCDALENVFYSGTSEEWEYIEIAAYNESLLNSTRYYQKLTPVKGDANCDNIVDVRDVTIVNQYVVRLTDMTEQGLLNADVISDGTVDIKDLGQIKKYIIKVISEF